MSEDKIVFCLKNKSVKPKPKDKTIRVSAEVADELKDVAYRCGESVCSVASRLLSYALKHIEWSPK